MLSFSLIFVLLQLASASTLATHSPHVETSSGDIVGHDAPGAPDVNEYLGIRWGQNPTGSLRFQAPKPFRGHGTFNASKFPLNCPSNKGKQGKLPGVNFTPQEDKIMSYFLDYADFAQGEDCLALNVWSKKGAKNRPVIFYLYGGEFRAGGTNNPFQLGQHLADAEDLVVVTANYRIDIFGFSGAPNSPANVGLLDTRMALEWVRDNIEAFGGDPTRITAIGQSAGAFAIDYNSYAYADPIAAGHIFQSGQATSLKPNALEEVQFGFNNVSSALGCGTGKNQLKCMQSKSVKDILAVMDTAVTAKGIAPVFQAAVDNKTVFGNYSAITRRLARVPSLIGNNNYEPGFYKLEFAAEGKFLNDTAWEVAQAVIATCPAVQAATTRAKLGIPTWQYRYFGQFDNLQLYLGDGAWHGSEIPMVFGTSQEVSGIAPSAQQQAVSRYMMKAWAAFASDPRDGLCKFGWPKLDVDGETLVRIAYDNFAGADFVKPSQYDQVCARL